MPKVSHAPFKLLSFACGIVFEHLRPKSTPKILLVNLFFLMSFCVRETHLKFILFSFKFYRQGIGTFLK